jgi:protein-disulfide isomerase
VCRVVFAPRQSYVRAVNPSPVSEHDHVLGPADAPVTLIEYGDYECPFCVKAYPAIESVRRDFGEKLRFVYRHVPKSASKGFAKQAAEAAEFAAAHGKFWEMHAQLFLHTPEHDLEHLLAAAKIVGLDPEACRTALVGRTYAERVRELSVASVRSGIIGTPTLFINGEHYDNRLEEELLHAAVSRALGKAEPLAL